MRCRGRFASWMCTQQICSVHCVMLSCQRWTKGFEECFQHLNESLLNNTKNEEWRQFWRHKEVQPGPSKVYLIKCLVSAFKKKKIVIFKMPKLTFTVLHQTVQNPKIIRDFHTKQRKVAYPHIGDVKNCSDFQMLNHFHVKTVVECDLLLNKWVIF